VPEALHTIEALLKERMPERHLLDILKNVHHWVEYTRHFGPPSGADPKLTVIPCCVISLPSFAMPVSSAPPKRRVIPMG
jgi:hypothetical protein